MEVRAITVPVPPTPKDMTMPLGDTRHVDDPSALTTAQLHREITILRELLDALFLGAEEINVQRFAAIEKELSLVERQRVEQKSDTKAAVDAALTAQKEAVKEQTTASDRAIAKSEMAMTKQLEQLQATFATAINGVTLLLNDAKERIVKIEANKSGGDSVVTKILAGIGGAAGVIAIIIGVLNMGR